MNNKLFPTELISQQVQNAMPSGMVVRPLEAGDFEKGFLDCLSMLTNVGTKDKAMFIDRFSYLKAHNHEYFTIVLEDTTKSKIVGAGTILVERKFVHGNGLVGHIEDIVTHKDYRGMNLGKLIIEALTFIGKRTGCYKIILDCSDKNVPFYQKCGFTQKEVEMVMYLPENERKMAKL